MHVHDDVLGAGHLAQRRLDLGERRAPRAQVEVPAHADHAEAHAVALDRAYAVAGLAAQEVDRPQYPRLRVQVGVHLAPVVGVVAEGDRIDAGGDQLIGEPGRDAQAAGDVLAVGDHERGLIALAQERQALQQRAPADAPDDVAHEQDAGPAAVPRGSPVRAARRLQTRGGRLLLSHTLPMMGGT